MSYPGYSDKVLALFLEARHGGELPQAEGEGWAGTLESGRYLRVQLRLHADERVAEARFGAPGCAPAIAAAEWVADWATGRSAEEISHLTGSDVLTALGGLPQHRRVYASMAVEALRAAMTDALAKKAVAS